MADRLQFNFSQPFKGVVWSMMVSPAKHLLILEIRNEDVRETRFSAFNYQSNAFLWRDVLFEEPWWIGLTAVQNDVMLLHVYENTENPDEKSLLAFDILRQQQKWQLKNFSFSHLHGDNIAGQLTKPESSPVTISLETGKEMPMEAAKISKQENIETLKPFQYTDGHAYFETVKSFLAIKMNVEPISCVEYMEYNSLIFISYHIQADTLANYLVVFDESGTLVANEKLGEGLKGIGYETFFILEGCLIFVRNRGELVSYRIV